MSKSRDDIIKIEFQDRASAAEPKGWDIEGGGNDILCGWGNGDYTIQGSNNI